MKTVFITGPQRSGTTLLEKVINSHPNAYITHEINWLHIVNSINNGFFSKRHPSRKVLDYEGDYLELIERIYKSSTRKSLACIGDKDPDYVGQLGELDFVFPGSLYLFCIRKPVAVINSMKVRAIQAKIGSDRGWDQEWDLEQACEKYRRSIENYINFRKDERIIVVKYEDFVCTRDTSAIAEFLAIPNVFDCRIIEERKARDALTDKEKKHIKTTQSGVAREVGYDM